jgi:hypothetical protein
LVRQNRLLSNIVNEKQRNLWLKLSELIGSLSYALDITEGQPAGHCVRVCWIGMHIGRDAGMEHGAAVGAVLHLLLKDLGCSSNAARICELYLTDDLDCSSAISRPSATACRRCSVSCSSIPAEGRPGRALPQRDDDPARRPRDRPGIDRHPLPARRRDRAPAALSRSAWPTGIYSLDEHFNGKGKPAGLAAKRFPSIRASPAGAGGGRVPYRRRRARRAAEARSRAGSWFDPRLVAAFERVSAGDAFWEHAGLARDRQDRVRDGAGRAHVALDDDYLDDIATAFGQVVDSKSPYTSGHSSRVALYTDMIAEALGLSSGAAGSSAARCCTTSASWASATACWIKPARSTATNGRGAPACRIHRTILGRASAPSPNWRRIAGAHHERLDGGGYPRGLKADQIDIETRIITTADIFDAITAERPYRGAIPVPQALEMMEKTVGTALDGRCFDALKRGAGARAAHEAGRVTGGEQLFRIGRVTLAAHFLRRRQAHVQQIVAGDGTAVAAAGGVRFCGVQDFVELGGHRVTLSCEWCCASMG